MKSNIMIYICLLICIVSASTLLNEEKDLQQQLNSHMILKKVKTCSGGNCKPGKTSTFKMMVDFDIFQNMKDQVIKPYVTRYFKSFSMKEKLYQEPQAQCLDKNKQPVLLQTADTCKGDLTWENKWNDGDILSRKKVSNLEMNAPEVDWDSFVVQPKLGKENHIEFNFKLKSFKATVDITTEKRMDGMMDWMKQKIWGNVPWDKPVVTKGEIIIDDFNFNMVIELQPNQSDLPSCFNLRFNNIEITWKNIHLTNVLGGGVVEFMANWALGFKSTLQVLVNNAARPIMNYKLKKLVQSFEEFNVPMKTQNSVLNFQCATQATQGPQIVKQNNKNYFEFGLHMEFQQIKQVQPKKDDEVLKRLQQRLMKTNTCEHKIPSLKLDFNLQFIEDFKKSVLIPYFKESFIENDFKMEGELYNSEGTILKDFDVKKLSIDWDKFFVKPLVEQNGAKSKSVLEISINLKDFEGQIKYEYPGLLSRLIESKWAGNAAFGIKDFVINIQIEMEKSTQKSCMKMSVKDISFAWSELLFNPFDNTVLNWFTTKGANAMTTPIKSYFYLFGKDKVQTKINELMNFETTKLFELQTPDNGDLTIEFNWSATEAPNMMLNGAGESDLHTAFNFDFKDVTNYPYIDGKIKCWENYEKCGIEFYALLEKQVHLDKYETGITECAKIRKTCLSLKEVLNVSATEKKQEKILRLAKQYKKQVDHERRFNQKKQLQNKNNLKKHHKKQQFLF